MNPTHLNPTPVPDVVPHVVLSPCPFGFSLEDSHYFGLSVRFPPGFRPDSVGFRLGFHPESERNPDSMPDSIRNPDGILDSIRIPFGFRPGFHLESGFHHGFHPESIGFRTGFHPESEWNPWIPFGFLRIP